MTEPELKKLTLVNAARLIRQREISPVELMRAVLRRIGRIDSQMRAYITVANERALERSGSAERKSLRKARPLLGIPIALKDLYDTRGIRTTAGSRVFADRIPERDSTVASRLNAAGAVLVGKTNMHEFAFGVTTVNPHYGTARNPWDPNRISGGSSGGSASAVALSAALGSMGSDTGGSIRIPAALCGIAGLKPTYGRVSLAGVIPLAWTLDHAGPMAKTVEDAAALLEIVAGYDRRDPCTRKISVARYTEALDGNVRSIRIGVPRSYFFERLTPEVESAVQEALRTLERLGAQLLDVDIPSAPLQQAIFDQIASPEAYSYHEPFLKTMADLYSTDVRSRIEAGRLLLSVDYVRAQRARSIMKEEFNQALQLADVIVTPTVPTTAPLIEQTALKWGNDSEPIGSALTRFTRPFNLAGLPAISIPCGFSSEGLPIGVQIAGKAFDEATVLRVAHAYEQDARWFEKVPAI